MSILILIEKLLAKRSQYVKSSMPESDALLTTSDTLVLDWVSLHYCQTWKLGTEAEEVAVAVGFSTFNLPVMTSEGITKIESMHKRNSQSWTPVAPFTNMV